jgi:hypothetical protein
MKNLHSRNVFVSRYILIAVILGLSPSANSVAEVIRSREAVRWTAITQMIVNDDALYCAAKNGILVLSLEDPVNPVFLVGYTLSGINKIAMHDDILFAATDTSGLVIFDISNSSGPRIMEQWLQQNRVSDIHIFESTASVVLDDSTVALLDISNSPEFRQYCMLYLGRKARFSVVDEDRLCVGTYDSTFVIFDISDTSEPILGGEYKSDWAIMCAQLLNGIAYIADVAGEIEIIDFSSSNVPVQIGQLLEPFQVPANFLINGNYLFASNGYDGGFMILDITDTTAPWIVSSVRLGEAPAYYIATYDEYAYVSEWPNEYERIYILDISDVSDPRSVGYYFLGKE